jgi:predicted DNA-binding transcriptional regulator YafY
LWYVIAWDRGRNGARLFRADRIGAPTVTDHRFVPRPAHFVSDTCPDARPALIRRPR